MSKGFREHGTPLTWHGLNVKVDKTHPCMYNVCFQKISLRKNLQKIHA